MRSNAQEENVPPEQEDEQAHHLSRKERQKAAKAAEREERRLFEQERRQQQHEAQEVAKMEKKKRERLEAQRLEKERQMRLEAKEAQQEAEYREWNTFLASSTDEKTMTVHEFVEYAKEQKVPSIDNLAEEYQRPSDQVRKRIQDLIDSGRVTGIVDGDKFIYMTSEELTSVAKFIMERKEVSLQELAKSTGSLIKF